jgi:hypothetical protein
MLWWWRITVTQIESGGRMPYQMTFHNTRAEDLNLQIKEGAEDCQTNPVVYDSPVEAGESYAYQAQGPVVCYRNTGDPFTPADGVWTPWVTFMPTADNTPVVVHLRAL